MITAIAGCIVGGISLILGLVLLYLIIDTRKAPLRSIEGPFRELEHQVAKQWEAVESGLGRVSRLKRELLEKERLPKGEMDAEALRKLLVPAGTPVTAASSGRPEIAKSRHDVYAEMMAGSRADSD